MPQLPRGPAASVGEDRRGGSVKVRRRTQGKREASVWPWACAFLDDEEGEKRR